MAHLSSTRVAYMLAGFGAAALLLAFSVFSQSNLQVGYAVVDADEGNSAPVATALFSFRNAEDVLVAEAGVETVRPLRRGRIFVDLDGTRTGVALANPSNQSVTADVVLRDSAGAPVDQTEITLEAGRHLPRFVDDPELFPDLPAGFTGSLTFETQPGAPGLAAVTLRQGRNAHGEPLLATLPVVDLSEDPAPTNLASPDSIVFPHIGAGAGGGLILSTQFILINPTNERIAGQIRLTTSGGSALEGELDGVPGSEFAYELQPAGTYRTTLTSQTAVVQGYAVVDFDGTTAPAGTAVFQFRDAANVLVSEAGVGAVPPTQRARIFVDTVRTQTGVALASPGNDSAAVTFDLFDRYGFPVDVIERQVPAEGHLARFASDLFTNLPPGFTGLLEIRSEVPFVPITLKLTTNRRNDLILTTLPVVDLNRPRPAGSLVFPQIGFGQGFSTRLILINPQTGPQLLGNIRFVNSNGAAMVVPVLGEPVSQVSYNVAAGGALQLRPANTATAAKIEPDPGGIFLIEVAITLGNTVAIRPLVIDTDGEPRDDFPLTFASTQPETASVDEFGRITGLEAGASTLTLSAGSAFATMTISVNGVNYSASDLEIAGISRDLSGRFYLANSQDHTILRAENVQSPPVVYAGVTRNSGFRNDQRLNALFDEPACLALNQRSSVLYVADAENHVIRLVEPGPEGRVRTLAGTGQAGSQDGSAADASFNSPQGLALDNRGHLWITDSANHTIRRISLSRGEVETVAGTAGQPGSVDGVGGQARFNAPVGVALEAEPLPQQLAQPLDRPPAPISVVVADTGNGLLRRVWEDGRVETISPQANGGSTQRRPQGSATSPNLVQPTGVAVDPFGNIFITEPNLGEVKLLLRTGQLVRAVQSLSVSEPIGLAVAPGGRIAVSDADLTAYEIVYGTPEITSVSPASVSSRGGQMITIRGRNFFPESLVLIDEVVLDSFQVVDTRRIVAVSPQLPSGRATITIVSRGGLAQRDYLVRAVSLQDLPAGFITTVAGGGLFIGDGLPAAAAPLRLPQRLAIDGAGNLYLSDSFEHRIRRIDASTGIITSIAGSGRQGFSGDGGLAVAGRLDTPIGVAVDLSGNVLFSDLGNLRVREIQASTGILRTVAGNGASGSAVDGVPATDSPVYNPGDLETDLNGDLYIAQPPRFIGGSPEDDVRIRKVDRATGLITTVAGTGSTGSGQEGPATAVPIAAPLAIAVADNEDLFFSAGLENIMTVDARTGSLTRIAIVAESGLMPGFGVEVDSSGNVYFPDILSGLYRIDPGAPLIGVPPRLDRISDLGLAGIRLDGAGNLYGVGVNQVFKVDLRTGQSTPIAGTGEFGFRENGVPAQFAVFRSPSGVAVEQSGDLVIADSLNSRIVKVRRSDQVLTTAVQLDFPEFPFRVESDSSGNLFYLSGRLIVFGTARQIHRVDSQTRAVSVVPGVEGASIPDLAAAGSGQLVFINGHSVQRVDVPTGAVETLAGLPGASGFAGDGGPAANARFRDPQGIALDAGGNIFIADSGNYRIRRIDAQEGTISTVAGTGNRAFFGDGRQATAASFLDPADIAVDSSGNLLIHDENRIRRVDGETGVVTTIAGNGVAGFVGDGVSASSTSLNMSTTSLLFRFTGQIATDSMGNLFIADTENHRVRVVRGSGGG